MQIRLPELQLQMQIQIQALCTCICKCIINTHNMVSMYALRSLWIDDWAAGHRRISSNRNEVIVLLLLSIWLVTSLVRSLYLSLHLSLFLSLSYKKHGPSSKLFQKLLQLVGVMRQKATDYKQLYISIYIYIYYT